MVTRCFMSIALAGLSLTLAPSIAAAHGKHKGKESCEKPLGCWIWSCQEIEETVYDYEVKERKVTVREPYIREIEENVDCKACIPVATTSLRTCPETDYARDAEQVMEKSCRIEKSCCGEKGCGSGCGDGCQGCPIEEVTPKIKTCMTRIEVSRQIPVLEWQLVPTNQPFKRLYYVRDWRDKEETVSELVKTPKTIKRKIWSKVPAPQCDCPTCETCGEAAPVVEEKKVEEVPVETAPKPIPD